VNYKFLKIVFFLFAGGLLSAQTAAELETLLESSAVTYGQAAMFVIASAKGELSGEIEAAAHDDSSYDSDALTQKDYFDRALALGWIPEGAAAGDPVTLDKLSFLMMSVFEMKGGLMYAIFPGPRYAYRSMVSKNIIQGTSDPGMKVSGERFILILGNALSFTEEE